MNTQSRKKDTYFGLREIDTAKYLKTVWKNLPVVIIFSMISAIIAMLISVYLIKPLYRADFTVFVNNRATDTETQLVSSTDTAAAMSLARTYSVLITNRSVLEPAAQHAGIDLSYEQVREMVRTDIEADTQLINVHVTGESSKDCLKLARWISETAPDYVENIIDGTSMKIVSQPVSVKHPVYPNVKKNTMFGGIFGFCLSLLTVFLLFIFNTKISDIKELEEIYGVPVVGTIPTIRQEDP
jgi:capsular polysaccharide biosynthesis protein